MCQICAGVMHKPYVLSLCGHICCLTCLQEWFQSQRANEDEDGGSRNRKTCPHCRAKMRSRPVQVFVVKAVVEALGIEPEEKPAPLPGSAPTYASAVSDDPWHGIFADADDYGEDDEEVEDYYIGHDEDDLNVCEACGADFDLDGYCVGCGAPADFGYSDDDDDEEDAAVRWRSREQSIIRRGSRLARSYGLGHRIRGDDPGHAITEEDPDNWTLPRPAPPMHELSREEHNHLNSQEFALCSRGVPFDMIHKYRMQYDSTRGISLQAEHQFSASVFFKVHYDRDSEDEDRVGRVEFVGHRRDGRGWDGVS